VGERTQHYLDSLRQGGGESFLLSSDHSLAGFDGLHLTGGVDIDPCFYGQRRDPHTQRPHRQRDQHELEVLRQALERDLPVLAICRGHQLLNVVLGGMLLQHLDGHSANDGGDSAWHGVRVEAGTRLWAACDGADRLRVNSRHHQAVTGEGLSPRLRAVAVAGAIVEAAESRDHRWVLGVQWHPERPEMGQDGQRLFRAFVLACGEG
jgi:putative glutamine amidotransferase